MPQKHKRVPGSRHYQDYTTEKLNESVKEVKEGRMSARAAEREYGIPRKTIGNKLKAKHMKQVGRPTVLTECEEVAFKEHVITMSDYGFPFDTYDLRMTVKCFLDKKGVKVNQFKNNLPGTDWCHGFLKRHKDLTKRFACNIKKKQAAISERTISQYISNLEKEVEGVPPSNILNYDETNLMDDPGNKKVLTKRGSKYPERVLNTSKSSISLMYCGTASGSLLPPYVVYKAENLWDSWCIGGPKGTRYNRSKSGWFDVQCFHDWFFSIALPYIKKLNGKKIMIGDNLSSHINKDVVNACQENEISFICLPPNSTHLTQPLDVAFFRSMKAKWRTLLTEWKRNESSRKTSLSIIPKDRFPCQLKQLHDEMAKTAASNLKSGFRKAGTYPLNKDEILQRLPQKREDASFVSETFIGVLSELWSESCPEPKQKRRRVNVEPGKSVSHLDITGRLSDELSDDEFHNMIR